MKSNVSFTIDGIRLDLVSSQSYHIIEQRCCQTPENYVPRTSDSRSLAAGITRIPTSVEGGRHSRKGEVSVADIRMVEDPNKGWGGENVKHEAMGVAKLRCGYLFIDGAVGIFYSR